jgi:hypothetical protein
MTIANPIYDIVFKYLMEDLDIAKGLLSTILDVEITALTLQPQETISETPQDLKLIRVYRIDFAAIIQQKNGKTRKVLIELQKTKRSTTVARFRRYLADNYQKEDTIIVKGIQQKRPLELITIYLLGFTLDKITTAVLHANPSFRDVLSDKAVENAREEDFVSLLTHESYFIQIPKLAEPTKTKIEEVLSVFNQALKTKDEHTLNYEAATQDPLVQKILTRLTRAIADGEMRRKMDIEDEIEQEFQEIEDKFSGLLEEKDAIIGKKDAMLEKKDAMLEKKDAMLEKKDAMLEEKDAIIEALKQQLAAKK